MAMVPVTVEITSPIKLELPPRRGPSRLVSYPAPGGMAFKNSSESLSSRRALYSLARW
jgi:hypothetical protein